MENFQSLQNNKSEALASTYELSFKGTGGELFKVSLVNMLLMLLTLGFYYPWAKVKMTKYIYHNTLLADSSFEYHGKPRELLLGYFLVLLFIVQICVFIFGIFHTMGLEKGQRAMFFIYLIIILLIPLAIHKGIKFRAAKSSWRNIFFGYRGVLKEFALLFYKNIILTIVTLGVYGSWMSANIQKYIYGHLRFGNVTFGYCGLGMDRFKINIKGLLLTIFSFGIYSFWWSAEILNYDMENTYLVQNKNEIRLNAKFSGGELFGFMVVNYFLILFTLGLGYPWVLKRSLDMYYRNIETDPGFDPNAIVQTEADYKDASGESFLDAFDLV